jgi:hypothetical protein
MALCSDQYFNFPSVGYAPMLHIVSVYGVGDSIKMCAHPSTGVVFI